MSKYKINNLECLLDFAVAIYSYMEAILANGVCYFGIYVAIIEYAHMEALLAYMLVVCYFGIDVATGSYSHMLCGLQIALENTKMEYEFYSIKNLCSNHITRASRKRILIFASVSVYIKIDKHVSILDS
ncbi:hypothetical protein R6Q59_016447 [Mikania micrantha]